MQTNDQETALSLFKALLAWLGALLGSITLSKLVLLATLAYTVLQIYVLTRDKIFRRGMDG